MNILVVDDQPSARHVLRRILAELPDVRVAEAETLEAAQARIEVEAFDLLLVDLRLRPTPQDRGGLELLRWVRERGHSPQVVVVTAFSEMVEVREAMRLGAHDYVLKDELSPEMLLPIVRGVGERVALRREVRRLRRRVDASAGLGAIAGRSPAMSRVRELVRRVADADATVLITGETGAGKDLVARAIHEEGRRREHPFVAINCATLPATLIESMIFGHERGAFTGAHRRARGHLELAGEGTFLLDEIAEMPLELQAKLLRVLEERRFRPLGAELELTFRARLLVASHTDLGKRVRDGRFRDDLYYRLNVVRIEVPPLRERVEDIADIVAECCRGLRRGLRFAPDAVRFLESHPWPGNVRELRNTIERVALLTDAEFVDAAAIANLVGDRAAQAHADVTSIARAILALPEQATPKLDAVEQAVLKLALEHAGGNKSGAARLLGMHRKAFERRWARERDDQ
jgi:DNA-binding NtrC family response regulator